MLSSLCSRLKNPLTGFCLAFLLASFTMPALAQSLLPLPVDSAYGGILEDLVHTPNIKRMAKDGMVLNNAFCTNSICVPSRASILTGQYSNLNGVYTLSDALEPDSLNIAKVLNANGYQTAIIGKWHLKKEPTGFDYYNVLNDQGRYWDPILRTKENFHKKWQEWDVHKGFSTDVIVVNIFVVVLLLDLLPFDFLTTWP